MSKPLLLIVDDDEGIRTQLKWGLEGFDIITADSRQNAVEQFEKYHPQFVTLDLGLPPDVEGTSEGFSILAAILERDSTTTVIVVSASDKAVNSVKAVEQGAFEFYAKPIEIEALQQVLDRAVSSIDFD